MHQRFADAINSNPDDRATQLIYADWLDQQGDPRAEAWRVLVEEGKRPLLWYDRLWNWFETYYNGEQSRLDKELFNTHPRAYGEHDTFYSAMDAAAVAWVRCHRDPEFLRESAPV